MMPKIWNDVKKLIQLTIKKPDQIASIGITNQVLWNKITGNLYIMVNAEYCEKLKHKIR